MPRSTRRGTAQVGAFETPRTRIDPERSDPDRARLPRNFGGEYRQRRLSAQSIVTNEHEVEAKEDH